MKRKGDEKQTKKGSSNASPATLLVDNPSKWQSWWVRFRLSVVMILGFAAITWIGHWGLIGLVLALQIFGYRELSAIRASVLFGKTGSQKGNLPYSSPWLDVALFFTVQYFCYGFVIGQQFQDQLIHANDFIFFFYRYHVFISFSMMMACLVAFVATLEKTKYLEQFQYLTWTIMTLAIVLPSNFHIFNIFQGLFWFVLPVSLIICNDITAYIWGFFFGKHSLIKLSPKKTWEGFIGAFFSTVVFAFLIASFVCKFELFACPLTEVLGSAACSKGYAFKKMHYEVPALLNELMGFVGIHWIVVAMYPAQVWAVWFGIFASTIAPFGGFLASGFKRAFGFKDFGNLIPGHGGIIDRMDCQVMMATFSTVFYLTFVHAPGSVSVVQSSIDLLPLHQQLDLFNKLQASLAPILG